MGSRHVWVAGMYGWQACMGIRQRFFGEEGECLA